MIFYQTIFLLQVLPLELGDAIDAAQSKFDREFDADCPNAILVLLLQIQELWMDIMPQTLANFSSDKLKTHMDVN